MRFTFSFLNSSLGNLNDYSIWSLMPHLYAATLWTLAYEESSAYNFEFEGLESNAHCIAAGFEVLSEHAMTALAKDDPGAITAVQKDFVTVIRKILLLSFFLFFPFFSFLWRCLHFF